MKQFLDMPLWLSIPLAVTYILAWGGHLHHLLSQQLETAQT